MPTQLVGAVARQWGTMVAMVRGGSRRGQVQGALVLGGRRFAWVLAGVVLGGASGCYGDDDPPVETVDSVALERPVDTLPWVACGEIECATVDVPIDYAAPEAGTISIAINRVRANPNLPYRGVIVTNPGGPGGAGKPFVANSATALRIVFPGFDFIGFDPRGVGESAALGCVVDYDIAQEYADSGVEGVYAALDATSRRCAEEGGLLFQHMGSHAVVSDIDRIREALGHEQINFFGISYGTRLAALYAMTFPERARAIVMDAPVPPSANIIEVVDGQFEATLGATNAFFADCAAGTLDCPADTSGVFTRMLADSAADGQEVEFARGWGFYLTTPQGRDRLAEIVRAFVAQEDDPEAAPVDMMGMMEDSSQFVPTVSGVANLATNCTDNTAAPLSVSEGQALMASFTQRSPDFAMNGLAALSCSAWNVLSDPVELAFTPRVAPLVIGGEQDSLTPLQWAQEVTAAMPGSSLLVSGHYGHSATLYAGNCVFRYLQNYLNYLRLPPVDAHCAAP